MDTGGAFRSKEGSSIPPGVDPGWVPALKRSWLILLPLINVFTFNKLGPRSKTGGVTALRAVWLGMVGGMVIVVLVTLQIARGEDPRPPSFFPAMVVAYGLVILGFVFLTRRRPLADPGRVDINDPATVALAYRSKMLLCVALSEGPLLLGFVGAFVAERPALIFVGIPFAVIGFMLCAPTAGDIRRRQEELTRAGSSVSLLDALTA